MARRPLLAFMLASLGWSVCAHAQTTVPLVPVDAPVPVVRSGETPELQAGDRPGARFGGELSVGIPSGATATLVVAPWHFLRLHVGAAHDGVGPGVVGAMTLAPFDTFLAPVLGLQAGHMFERDGSAQLRQALNLDAVQAQVGRRLGYDFLSAELGVELGLPDRVVVGAHLGLAGVQATLHDAGPALGLQPGSADVGDIQVRALIPSVRVGLLFFI